MKEHIKYPFIMILCVHSEFRGLFFYRKVRRGRRGKRLPNL